MTATICQWQPDPTHGPPPRCWVQTTAARSRLNHACSVLRHHGIVACAALGDDPEQARHRMHDALADRLGSGHGYMFWTLPDDLDCFTIDGSLIAALPLYVDGPAVAAAVLDVLDQMGLHAEMIGFDDVVLVAAQ